MIGDSTEEIGLFGWRRKYIVNLIGWVSTVLAIISIIVAFCLRPEGKESLSNYGYYLLGFWAIIPPVWFFFEYVFWPPVGDKSESRAKHLHDLARNIWVALIVILAAIMGVKWPP